jgi:anhydro-N-acetylmuramic acid kinase
MELKKILNKKSIKAIGLNSGTSADGLDLAAVEIKFSSRSSKINFIKGRTIPYPKELLSGIKKAIHNKINSMDEIIRLDRQLGNFYGKETAKFVRSLQKKRFRPDIIGSHGQTVRHLPGRIIISGKKESGTMQLGHPETIAGLTGLLTVADFRQADIAAGGEGAPITSYPMQLLFADNTESRLLVNIGGIANYFLFPAKSNFGQIEARDCGPGNSLLDILTEKYFHRRFDHKGLLASQGEISMRLLSLLLADNFLKGNYGISTGRERFGEQFAEKIARYGLRLNLNKYDILATATELTAVTIARNVRDKIFDLQMDQIYLFGGGAKNSFLLKRLKANLPGVKLMAVNKLGFDSDYLEAVCYAVMAALAIKEIPIGLSQITGARDDTISGRIILKSPDNRGRTK